MTRNPVGDQEDFSAVFWSSIANAANQEAIVSGCVPADGAGDWTVDISSGEAVVQGTAVTVEADTVTVDVADTVADRVDLVTVDGAGDVSVTRGAQESDGSPAAPDIPDGEVLIAAVLVGAGSASLSDDESEIVDYRTLYELSPTFDDVTATSATVDDSLTDPSGTEHTGELADAADLHDRYSDEEVQDVVGALVSGGTDVSVSYDDGAGTLTVDTSALNEEEVEDAVAAMLTTDSNLTLNYDDANDALTLGLADDISAANVDAGSVSSDSIVLKDTSGGA